MELPSVKLNTNELTLEDEMKLQNSSELPVILLQHELENFAICCEHFGENKEGRTSTSFPTPVHLVKSSGGSSPISKNSESSIEIVGPPSSNLILLHTQEDTNVGPMCPIYCNAKSNTNADICALKAHESHYGHQVDNTDYNDCIETPDFSFAILQTSQHESKKRTCAFDESTEVLLQCDESQSKEFHHNCSGTDSDVEVLTSEEIHDSDWSVEAPSKAVLCKFKKNETVESNNLQMSDTDDDEKVVDPSTSTSTSLKQSETFSLEEFNHSSIACCERLNKAQLLNVIRDQAERISYLEAMLQRYRRAHITLFDHIDAMRDDLKESNLNIQKSHDTIN